MKITTATLRRLIKEEIQKLNEYENTQSFLDAYESVMKKIHGGVSAQITNADRSYNSSMKRSGNPEKEVGHYMNQVRFTTTFDSGTSMRGDKHMGRQPFHMPDNSMMVMKEITIDMIVNTPLESSGRPLYDKMYKQYYPDITQVELYFGITIMDIDPSDEKKAARAQMSAAQRAGSGHETGMILVSDPIDVQPNEESGQALAKAIINAIIQFHNTYNGKTLADIKAPTTAECMQILKKHLGRNFSVHPSSAMK